MTSRISSSFSPLRIASMFERGRIPMLAATTIASILVFAVSPLSSSIAEMYRPASFPLRVPSRPNTSTKPRRTGAGVVFVRINAIASGTIVDPYSATICTNKKGMG
jgi:hypothetical protein